MCTQKLRQSAFHQPQSVQRHGLKVRETRCGSSGRELDSTRQPSSYSSRLHSDRLSRSLLRLCEDRTKYLIFCASTLTRAGSFCWASRSLAEREFSSNASCMSSSLFSDRPGNGSPQPEKTTSATGKSWRCTEPSMGESMTSQIIALFSRHSLAPKVTLRLCTFHTFPRRLSDVCSDSMFPT